ncbi:hypothetical protein [Teredinibacter haidensis]|uniref:hypothetical protein n=1 Tax=Teredinibacter haidensis TaxID=2731755 RepID=UPI000948F573|nr:hypothetical protein [Teredinibacter haidensis]
MSLFADTISLEDILFFAVTLTVFFSLAANVYMLFRKLQPEDNEKLKKSFIKQLKSFLKNQTDSSKINVNKHFLRVKKFRSAYLDIENAAINRNINSNEYRDYINENIFELIRSLEEKAKQDITLIDINNKVAFIKKQLTDKNNPSIIKLKGKLEKFHSLCKINSSNTKSLLKNKEKIEQLAILFGSQDFINTGHLTKAQNNYINKSNNILKQIKSTSKEEFNISSHCDTIGEHLLNLRNKLESVENDLFDSEEAKSINNELLDYASNIQDLNEDEIKNLKDKIKALKKTIILLEEKLDISRHEPSQQTEEDILREKNLKSLKSSLNKATKYIDKLESELKTVRDTQCKTETLAADNTPTHSGNDFSPNSSQEHSYRHNESLLLFVQDSIEANTVEDISLVIYQFLLDLAIQPSILIFGNSRVVELDNSGKVPKNKKVIIDSMHDNEINSTPSKITFKIRHIAGILSGLVSADDTPDFRETAIAAIKFADSILAKIKFSEKGQRQHMQITHLSDDMKKLMHDTEFLFKEFSQSANEKDPVKIYIGHCQVTLKRKMLEILKKIEDITH